MGYTQPNGFCVYYNSTGRLDYIVVVCVGFSNVNLYSVSAKSIMIITLRNIWIPKMFRFFDHVIS